MKTREQKHAFLMIMIDRDVLPCFMVSAEGGERFNFQ